MRFHQHSMYGLILLGLTAGVFTKPVSAQTEQLQLLLGTALGCELTGQALANMPVAPLYSRSADGCVETDPVGANTALFEDGSCTTPTTFVPTSLQAFCSQAIDRAALGNGLGIVADSWSLTPGNQVDLGSRTLEGVQQPYVQRLVYRQVQTDGGRCDLEMRVYKSHPSASNNKSLVAFHGGSWTSRSFGFLGLELTVPHFVAQGFTVYAPFYRLLDSSDSSIACHNASFEDITDDASAALDWVLENSSSFGDSGTPLVFGQSAGGHLALSLAINRPSAVAAAVSFYPPADFGDFLQRVQNGRYTNPQGLGVLDRIVNADALNVSASLPLVLDNSFPQRVVDEGAAWPPMFLLQGASDDLVEYRQSVRLCDALANRELTPADTEVAAVNELVESFTCSAQTNPASTLTLVQQGEHALDVCLDDRIASLCPAGNAASRALVSQAIGEAVQFAKSVAVFAEEPDNADIGLSTGEGDEDASDASDASDADMMAAAVPVVRSGGGAATGLLLMLLGAVFRKQR